MKKIIMICKHIHSCFAGSSGNDAWLKLFVNEKDLDFKPEVGKTILSKKYPMLTGEEITEVEGDSKFMAVYVEADKTFYNLGLSAGRGIFGSGYHDTLGFKELVESYTKKGWTAEACGERNPEQEAYWERGRVKEEKRAKKAGLVLWKRYDDLKPADYQGGFSDGVFNSLAMKQYVESGCVFGWIGHRVRHPKLDKVIEEGLRKRGLSDAAMYNWISSGDGRHFGDALEGYTLKEQIEKIEGYLNSMFNKCLIYGSSRHEGTAKSTYEIRADFEKEGILLPEDNSTYDPSGWMKLMTLAMAAGNKNISPELKEMLPGLAEEVLGKKKKKK